MKDIYLQTIVVGCAWCRKTISISTHEVDHYVEDRLIMLSHGICEECKENLLAENESEESENLVVS